MVYILLFVDKSFGYFVCLQKLGIRQDHHSAAVNRAVKKLKAASAILKAIAKRHQSLAKPLCFCLLVNMLRAGNPEKAFSPFMLGDNCPINLYDEE
nr:hypothetical protein [Pedobacter sp. ASV12]